MYAAYLRQLVRKQAGCTPIASATGERNEEAFQKWLNTYRPDIIMVHNERQIGEWLHRMGTVVPRDLFVFCVNAERSVLSGLSRDDHAMETRAAGMSLPAGGRLGLSSFPLSSHIEEMW